MSKNNTFKFRSAFNGFNRDDVIDYISGLCQRFDEDKHNFDLQMREEKLNNTTTIDNLRLKNESLTDELNLKDGDLESKNSRISELEEKLNEEINRYTSMQAQVEERVETLKRDYENTISEKDAVIGKLNEEIEELKESTNPLISEADMEELEVKKAEIEKKNVEIEELTSNNTSLKSLLDACNAQINVLNNEIASLKANSAGFSSADTDVINTLKAENEYLKRKYVQLQNEFNAAVTEAKNAAALYNENSIDITDANRRNVDRISSLAINAIKNIQDKVDSYMEICIGEFNTYSRDVCDSIAKLFEDVNKRSKQLDDIINSYKSKLH